MLVRALTKLILMEGNNGNNQGGGTGGSNNSNGTNGGQQGGAGGGQGSNNQGNGSSNGSGGTGGVFGEGGTGNPQGGTNNGQPGGNNGNGGQGAQNSGGQNAGGQGGGTPGSGNSQGGQGAQNIQIPENWKEVLPEEIRNFGTMGNIKTVEQLARSFMLAQKQIGMDKLPISKNPTEHEVKEIFKRIGMPETFDKYDVKLGENSVTNPRFVEEFKDAAFKAGVLPAQANTVLKFFEEQSIKANEAHRLKEQTKFNDDLRAIKDEWGDQYDENTARAKAALKEFAVDQKDIDYIKQNFGANAPILRILAKVGATLDEGKIRGAGGTGEKSGYTPSEAREKIAEYKKDPKGPYFNPEHPDHAEVKKEVNRLYGFAFPGNKK